MKNVNIRIVIVIMDIVITFYKIKEIISSFKILNGL
jgi:hypothetical protein